MTSSRDFQDLYRNGRKIAGRYFILFFRRRTDEWVCFGVTATRRLGNAVCRNRAKRLLREAVRHIAPETEAGCDLVLVARSEILKAGMQEVEDQLRMQLKGFRRIQCGERSN